MTQPISVDVIRRVREFLTPPERWQKNRYHSFDDYADYDRNSLDVALSNGVHFSCCILGAAFAVTTEDDRAGDAFEESINAALRPCILERMPSAADSTFPVVRFNDHSATTHSDVLEVLDCAIKRAETP